MTTDKNKLEKLKELELRLDTDLGCLFCTSCPLYNFPIGPSFNAYLQHRRIWHNHEGPLPYIGDSIGSLKLRFLQHFPHRWNGSRPLIGLPVFEAFQCSECKFVTLQPSMARSHQHTMSSHCWQSYFPPGANFMKSSWIVSSDASKSEKTVAAISKHLSSMTDAQKTSLSRSRGSETKADGVSPNNGTPNTADRYEGKLTGKLRRLQYKDLDQHDIETAIKNLIEEHGQDAAVKMVSPCTYRTIRQDVARAVTMETYAAGFNFYIIPLVAEHRWFLLVVCVRSRRVLCFDSLHQMRHRPITALVEHFKKSLKCDISSINCPKAHPMAHNAADSGVLIVGIVTRFLEDPEAAMQAAITDDMNFSWNIQLAAIRRQLIYRLAPSFYDACTAMYNFRCAAELANEQAKDLQQAESICKMGNRLQELSDCMASLGKRISDMKTAYPCHFHELGRLLALETVPLMLRFNPEVRVLLQKPFQLPTDPTDSLGTTISGPDTALSRKSPTPDVAIGNGNLLQSENILSFQEPAVAMVPKISATSELLPPKSTQVGEQKHPQACDIGGRKRRARTGVETHHKAKRQRSQKEKKADEQVDIPDSKTKCERPQEVSQTHQKKRRSKAAAPAFETPIPLPHIPVFFGNTGPPAMSSNSSVASSNNTRNKGKKSSKKSKSKSTSVQAEENIFGVKVKVEKD